MQTDKYKEKQIKGLKYSRGMKRKPTKAEKHLADALEINGIAFKQQAFFFTESKLYIPDFRIPTRKYRLIVEVDGASHKKQKEYDDARTQWLFENRNCRVIRFSNEQVLNNVSEVIKVILTHHPKSQAEIDADKAREARTNSKNEYSKKVRNKRKRIIEEEQRRLIDAVRNLCAKDW
jgi:very-short-patch-repair endonuclease